MAISGYTPLGLAVFVFAVAFFGMGMEVGVFVDLPTLFLLLGYVLGVLLVGLRRDFPRACAALLRPEKASEPELSALLRMARLGSRAAWEGGVFSVALGAATLLGFDTYGADEWLAGAGICALSLVYAIPLASFFRAAGARADGEQARRAQTR